MTSNLVLRSVGRVLWFAVAGALCMALVGVVTGAAIFALTYLFFNFSLNGISNQAKYLYPVLGALIRGGLMAGVVAFGIAGFFACFSASPQKVFSKALRLSWLLATVGIVLGFVSAIVDTLLFAPLMHIRPFFNPSAWFLGMLGGFVIGTFYGAIVGARNEIARQKVESKVALSTLESAA